MTFEGKPREVTEALNHQDHDALSAMGKRGAEHATLSRLITKLLKSEQLEERIHELAAVETLSSDGSRDVLPPEIQPADEPQPIH